MSLQCAEYHSSLMLGHIVHKAVSYNTLQSWGVLGTMGDQDRAPCLNLGLTLPESWWAFQAWAPMFPSCRVQCSAVSIDGVVARQVATFILIIAKGERKILKRV